MATVKAAKKPPVLETVQMSKQQAEKVQALQAVVDDAKGQLNQYLTAVIDGHDLPGRWDVVAFDPQKHTMQIKGANNGATPK